MSGKNGVIRPESSSVAFPAAYCPSTTNLPSTLATQYLNVLHSSGGSSSINNDINSIQYYNDFRTCKNTNMGTVKDINLKRDNIASGNVQSAAPEFTTNDVWNSLTPRSTSSRLTHQATIRESTFYKDPSFDNPTNHDRNINTIPIEHCKELNSARNYSEKTNNTSVKKWPCSDYQQGCEEKGTVDEGKLSGRSEKAKSWWRNRIPSTKDSPIHESSTKASITGSFRRSKFWNSLSKTLELPDKLRKEDKTSQKVPRLQIWLSTDTKGASVSSPPQSPVLNNTRENVPRIHLNRPSVINRRDESCRLRALSEGSSNTGFLTNNSQDVEKSVKSPVEKQPTWPVCHNLQPRPKLIHQNCLNINSTWKSNSEGSNRRLELPRQDAVWEEVELNKDNTNLKSDTEKENKWRKRCLSSESRSPSCKSNVPSPKPTLRLKNSTTSESNSTFDRFFRRSNTNNLSRSFSDAFDNGDGDINRAPSPSSVFSINDVQHTPSLSCASSVCSIQSESSFIRPADVHLSGQVPNTGYHHETLSPSQSWHYPPSRSNSTASTSLFGFAERSHFRLTIPGSDGSRRPSLLSLRSLTRSPIPYQSMDYDYESDYDAMYTLHSELMPEATPKLSFTQKLAFPTLHQNSIDRPKPRDPYTEADNHMNTVAKIITLVILTFITVFILGGLYKLVH